MIYGTEGATIEILSNVLEELREWSFSDNAMTVNYFNGNEKHAPTVTIEIDTRDEYEEPVNGIYELDMEEAAELHAYLGDALERGKGWVRGGTE